MSKQANRPERREIRLVNPSYQPLRAELREDLRMEGTFEDAIKALVRPRKIRYVRTPREVTK